MAVGQFKSAVKPVTIFGGGYSRIQAFIWFDSFTVGTAWSDV